MPCSTSSNLGFAARLRCCHGLWQVLGKWYGSDLWHSELGYKPREHTLGVADVLMFWHLLVGENQEHRISHLILLSTWLGSDFLKWCTHATAPKKTTCNSKNSPDCPDVLFQFDFDTMSWHSTHCWCTGTQKWLILVDSVLHLLECPSYWPIPDAPCPYSQTEIDLEPMFLPIHRRNSSPRWASCSTPIGWMWPSHSGKQTSGWRRNSWHSWLLECVSTQFFSKAPWPTGSFSAGCPKKKSPSEFAPVYLNMIQCVRQWVFSGIFNAVAVIAVHHVDQAIGSWQSPGGPGVMTLKSWSECAEAVSC